jgi:hypothetical protein
MVFIGKILRAVYTQGDLTYLYTNGLTGERYFQQSIQLLLIGVSSW